MCKLRIAAADERGRPKKLTLPMADLGLSVGKLLDEFQDFLYQRALDLRAAGSTSLDTWEEFSAAFEDDRSGFVYAHWDGTAETELAIKQETRATIRCLPLEGHGPAPEPGKCIKTGQPSERRVLFAKNY